jgi:hypothetical protein
MHVSSWMIRVHWLFCLKTLHERHSPIHKFRSVIPSHMAPGSKYTFAVEPISPRQLCARVLCYPAGLQRRRRHCRASTVRYGTTLRVWPAVVRMVYTECLGFGVMGLTRRGRQAAIMGMSFFVRGRVSTLVHRHMRHRQGLSRHKCTRASVPLLYACLCCMHGESGPAPAGP